MNEPSMHAEWTDRLSAYLDDELSIEERREVEAHLAACPACRLVLAELRAVTTWAASYHGRLPERDLWPGVRAGLARGRVLPVRVGTSGWWRLAAAAGIAAVALGGGLWLVRQAPAPGPVAVPPTAVAASLGEADVAVQELESLLAESRRELDSSTVRVIEESLALIDRAIAEARAAIQRDSANAYLNGRIAAHLKQKLAILRTATRAARDL